ncbi:MBL fold metallo-hydrolase [Halalkalibacterium halodurans]|jgi:glyoxylase-like metal-dependent hydrolase (beta-lactamase superfamily II)|nr:MBL fold metallo-hydrolase [Halalkalibacterium halodurans]
MMGQIQSVAEDIMLIDGFDLNLQGRTGSYLLLREELTLVETGPSQSVPYILKGLKQLTIDPKDIRHIVLTHIHLDHAGGVGLLLSHCPNADVYVHPKGARHLLDPSRLITGARQVYGSHFDALFDPVIPVPESKLISVEEGDTLIQGLTFLHTRGHANHHVSIYDEETNGIFTGDTLGVRYEPLAQDGLEFILPSTSPNQFDPSAMLESLKKIENYKVGRIYFGHFGVSHQPAEVYKQLANWLDLFVTLGESAYLHGERPEKLANRLLDKVTAHLRENGVTDDHKVYKHLQMDLPVCAMGLLHYFSRL